MGKLKNFEIDYDECSRDELIGIIFDLTCKVEDLEDQIKNYEDYYILNPRLDGDYL